MKFFFCLLMVIPSLVWGVPSECNAYFSNKDHLADKLIELINKEETSIKVAIYCMTHQGIAKALVRAKERGVSVEVIVDPYSIKVRSSIHQLVEAKIPLYVWDQTIRIGGKHSRSLMHDKFCILGRKVLWTGSFNFTHDANTRHQENVLVVESEEITEQYLQQFSQMKLYESRPFEEYMTIHPQKKQEKKSDKRYSKEKLSEKST